MSEEETQEPNFIDPLKLTFRDADKMRRYVTDTGKILPRKYTRLNARQQRHVARVIKQARNLLLMK